MYTFIEFNEIDENLKDGKYFTIAQVKKIEKDSIILTDGKKEIKFFSLFKPKEKEFVRAFFSKDKNNFTIDFLQVIEEKYLNALNIYLKHIKNYVQD